MNLVLRSLAWSRWSLWPFAVFIRVLIMNPSSRTILDSAGFFRTEWYKSYFMTHKVAILTKRCFSLWIFLSPSMLRFQIWNNLSFILNITSIRQTDSDGRTVVHYQRKKSDLSNRQTSPNWQMDDLSILNFLIAAWHFAGCQKYMYLYISRISRPSQSRKKIFPSISSISGIPFSRIFFSTDSFLHMGFVDRSWIRALSLGYWNWKSLS